MHFKNTLRISPSFFDIFLSHSSHLLNVTVSFNLLYFFRLRRSMIMKKIDDRPASSLSHESGSQVFFRVLQVLRRIHRAVSMWWAFITTPLTPLIHSLWNKDFWFLQTSVLRCLECKFCFVETRTVLYYYVTPNMEREGG